MSALISHGSYCTQDPLRMPNTCPMLAHIVRFFALRHGQNVVVGGWQIFGMYELPFHARAELHFDQSL